MLSSSLSLIDRSFIKYAKAQTCLWLEQDCWNIICWKEVGWSKKKNLIQKLKAQKFQLLRFNPNSKIQIPKIVILGIPDLAIKKVFWRFEFLGSEFHHLNLSRLNYVIFECLKLEYFIEFLRSEFYWLNLSLHFQPLNFFSYFNFKEINSKLQFQKISILNIQCLLKFKTQCHWFASIYRTHTIFFTYCTSKK